MPWRDSISPYGVFVSELMLQQTQVSRVLEKYKTFTNRFPDFSKLAEVSLAEVYPFWQGLGYNRRARFLHESAKIISTQYDGTFPDNIDALDALPGIGPATSAAISVYTFNTPRVFIETNIRSVFIHCFFQNQPEVDDSEIEPLVASSLMTDNPRDWYYALMDYGVYIKKNFPNPGRKSKQYKKQSPFKGSVREARGAVLRILQAQPQSSIDEIICAAAIEQERIYTAIEGLQKDLMVAEHNGMYSIS